jgi:hypothetical protein
MPFEQGAPMSFTASSIQNNAPDCSGVYGISNSSEWIFIGEAANIRVALLGHLREVGTPLSSRKPKGFSFEAASQPQRVSRKNQLVRELAPSCVSAQP